MTQDEIDARLREADIALDLQDAYALRCALLPMIDPRYGDLVFRAVDWVSEHQEVINTAPWLAARKDDQGRYILPLLPEVPKCQN